MRREDREDQREVQGEGLNPSYPPAPWNTHGRGVFLPYVVAGASRLELPPGLEPVHVGGFATGMLAFIEYLAPSPLTYSELIWMPMMVSARGRKQPAKQRGPDARSERRVKGQYVAVMYVDNEASLAAGREIWALPKTLARFERRRSGVDVIADDGTEISLDFDLRFPTLKTSSRMATLQSSSAGVVRFQAKFSGKAGLARARVTHFNSQAPAWSSFEQARRVGPAGQLQTFDSVMGRPTVLS